MTQETIKIKKLIAADGMILTNGDTYGKEIFLGSGDDVSNWHEITEAEYEEAMKEQLEDEVYAK
ncbi:MAG: hypothetical protein IJ370_04040 [Oscillospiraceae bacterium]|nr:hypothetical protein [Oscillospiraceae bacterium]MBQ8338544.1 hypothetical protein [Oscillospiraceae bacterium]